eukprot:3100457-Amphidinium_carterae.1
MPHRVENHLAKLSDQPSFECEDVVWVQKGAKTSHPTHEVVQTATQCTIKASFVQERFGRGHEKTLHVSVPSRSPALCIFLRMPACKMTVQVVESAAPHSRMSSSTNT